MEDLAKRFGVNLRAKRKELGIAQEKLALICEIDRSYLGRIERGEVNVTLEKVYQLAKAMKCNAKELLP